MQKTATNDECSQRWRKFAQVSEGLARYTHKGEKRRNNRVEWHKSFPEHKTTGRRTKWQWQLYKHHTQSHLTSQIRQNGQNGSDDLRDFVLHQD